MFQAMIRILITQVEWWVGLGHDWKKHSEKNTFRSPSLRPVEGPSFLPYTKNMRRKKDTLPAWCKGGSTSGLSVFSHGSHAFSVCFLKAE